MKIRDNQTGKVFEYGSNKHHALHISENGGCLTFENLENGDGSLETGDGGYSFVLDDGKTPEESSSPESRYGATYANIGGLYSPNVKDMLTEISDLIAVFIRNKRDYVKGKCFSHEYSKVSLENERIITARVVYNIVRKYLDNKPSEESKNNNDWIPVSSGNLPEEGEDVLVWYEYFRYGDYNSMYETYGIGSYFEGHWFGDVSGKSARCIAWMPLPEKYKPHEEIPGEKDQKFPEWRSKFMNKFTEVK